MQYPRMLYKGNQEKYQTVIADDENHEAELIADGWANYGELPEREQGMTDPYIGDRAAGSIDGISVAEQNKDLQEQLEESKAENAQLKEVIEKGSAENAELRKQMQLKELEDMPADDLKAMLDEKGVQYGARDNKATLVNLVLESDGGE